MPHTDVVTESQTAQTPESRVRGKACTVLGYGISNRPLVDWLVAHGARSVTVRDQRTREAMEADGDMARLDALGVRVICGKEYLDGVGGDLIFRTPGLRPDHPALLAAVAAGAVMTSEMELYLSTPPTSVVALPGSDGKTTTTTLTSLILEEAARRTGTGRVFLGGNIGTPLLSREEAMTAADTAVVELSSFQLMTMDDTCIPTRAAVTNISENHLNWHKGMEEYVAAKCRLLGVGGKHPAMVALNARNPETRAMGQDLPCPVVWFSAEEGLPADWTPDCLVPARGDAAVYESDGSIVYRAGGAGDKLVPVMPTHAIRLPGRHNMENYMTAIALTAVPLDGAPALAIPADVAAVAATFTGVAHRLEPVRTHRGVRYFNSSIDSSPARTEAALHALYALDGAARPPIVICGGQDKNSNFAPLAENLCRMASAVVLTGEARELIREAILACPAYDPARLPVTVIPDYREGMRAACEMAKDGDTVLLSPACTSFDAFRNFDERGEVFRAIVQALP